MVSGQADRVNENLIESMRDIEQMARGGLNGHEKRIVMLEEAERERLTKTTVLELIRIKDAAETVKWVKWSKRAALAGLGASMLGGLGWVLQLAWKGLHAT